MSTITFVKVGRMRSPVSKPAWLFINTLQRWNDGVGCQLHICLHGSQHLEEICVDEFLRPEAYSGGHDIG